MSAMDTLREIAGIERRQYRDGKPPKYYNPKTGELWEHDSPPTYEQIRANLDARLEGDADPSNPKQGEVHGRVLWVIRRVFDAPKTFIAWDNTAGKFCIYLLGQRRNEQGEVVTFCLWGPTERAAILAALDHAHEKGLIK